MKAIAFHSAWCFIFLAGALDGGFAWFHRDTFDFWELNPLARWLCQQCGLGTLLAVKALALTFAVVVALYCRRRRHRLEMPFTLLIVGFHVLMSCHYLAEYARPMTAAENEPSLAGRMVP
jgi:hypothetical protein